MEATSQIPNRPNNKDRFITSYLTKKEATFLLGRLKYLECTDCPDFHEGCNGNIARQEIAGMGDDQYLHVQIRGTEKHLCGKLRNIINLSAAEQQEIHMQFEESFNNRVSILSKKGDKYVLVRDVDEFENMSMNIQRQWSKRFENEASKMNKKNQEVFEQLMERVSEAEKTVIEQQRMIRKLQKGQRNER